MTRNEIKIAAPPEFVFPYLTEGDKIAQWSRDDRLKIRFPRGKEARVGMQVHFTIKLPTDPSWLVEIRALDAPHEMRTDITEGIFRGTISFLLAETKASGTRLVHEAVIEPQGAFMRYAWKKIGHQIHRNKMEEVMGRIKNLVEEEWRRSGQAAPSG
ncbi:MAG: SRPBCC family protein [Candidatus Lernaella stagnicola]|nr:SRPBCC family protein [Candidatus Lernaella stagnicola]